MAASPRRALSPVLTCRGAQRTTDDAPVGYFDPLRCSDDLFERRYAKEQLLKKARTWGLTNRRGKPLTSQAIGVLLGNQLYAGIIDVPEYGVRGKRGDFNC